MWAVLSCGQVMAGKYTQFDAAEDSTHNMVLGLVPRGTRVLEFGCATGYMSAELSSRLGCTVTGVELCAEAAEEARGRCARVIVGDAESLDLDAALGPTRFDVILFIDVLEHLRDPGPVLARARRFLADGGRIVASIPNVAHGSVRVALLQGEWRYRPVGLLDDTHLRFFTREGVQDLFEQNGYVITEWLRKRRPIEGSEIDVRVPEGLEQYLVGDPEVTTFQFVVRAVPSEPVHLISELRREIADVGQRAAIAHEQKAAVVAERDAARIEARTLADELATVRNELATVRNELVTVRNELETRSRAADEQRSHVDALASDIAALTATQTELRRLLLEAHRQLAERDDALREAHAQTESAKEHVRFVTSTKAWRLSTWYWRLLDLIRPASSRATN